MLYIKDVLDVSTENVKFVLLTHLHSDHISGVCDLLTECKNAKLYLPASITSESARRIIQIATLNRQDLTGLNQCLNLFEFIKENGIPINSVKRGDVIYRGDNVSIVALSPSQETMNSFNLDYQSQIDIIEKRLKQGNVPYRLPLSSEFNHHSIVLKVNYLRYNLLLCADLPVHKQSGLGLTPLLKDLAKDDRKITLFKVPHHGSHNGVTLQEIYKVISSDFNDWLSVLDENMPRFAMTAKSNVPQDKMVKEMIAITPKCYITTNPKKRYEEPKEAIKKEVNKTGLDIKYISKHYGLLRFWYSEIANELKFEPRNHAVALSDLLL